MEYDYSHLETVQFITINSAILQKRKILLHICDVYNIDKQDDSAAFRVFHSQLLRMCQDNRAIDSDKLSLFVELFDAYLNRKISYKTRIIMVMCTYFFLDFWKSHIKKTGKNTSNEWYSEHRTETLEYVFGLAHQVVPDFTAYKFFKILRRVMYCDKILRTGDFGIKKEKVSAT
ncbi:19345_t:CDS:2, partial [Rhizophagus irregularis]